MTEHASEDTIGVAAGGSARKVQVPDVSLLFRQHHADLVRLAVLLAGDQPTAEDIVQDVFTRLHAKSDRWRPQGDPLAYIRASVINGCRSVQRRRVIARRLGGLRDLHPDRSAEHSAEHEVIRSEDRRQVLMALAALPRRRKEVLVLRYYLGLSEAEIAQTLNITQGTVKSTAARGLAALATALAEEV